MKVKFDPKEEVPMSFTNCVDAIGNYKLEQASNVGMSKFHACHIYFGYHHSDGNPSKLRGQALDVQNPNPYGNIATVKKLMNINRITCENGEQRASYAELIFKFPLSNVGHKDYEEVKLKCHLNYKINDEVIFVSLGSGVNNTLAIDMRFGDTDTGTYHFLDTDSNGVIKKHVKVRGSGGNEEVILDNYQLMNE